jgi:hypothetical protein
MIAYKLKFKIVFTLTSIFFKINFLIKNFFKFIHVFNNYFFLLLSNIELGSSSYKFKIRIEKN